LATPREARDWAAYYALHLAFLREIIAEGKVYDGFGPWWDPQQEGT